MWNVQDVKLIQVMKAILFLNCRGGKMSRSRSRSRSRERDLERNQKGGIRSSALKRDCECLDAMRTDDDDIVLHFLT